jgi:antitoxin (DNA-binding transcriptional repressor) of toxin-antitoxin stability system
MMNTAQASGTRLTDSLCHINVSLMKSVSIRELRHDTGAVLDLVAQGRSLQVCRRGKPVALLSPRPIQTRGARPDFARRLKDIYGDAVMPTTAAVLVADSRGET